MKVPTIVRLTADELTELEFEKRLRKKSESHDLEDGTKYAVVLLKLAAAVTPADYPTLRTDIIGVTGVQDVTLLVDHETRASVLPNRVQVLSVRADVTLRDDTLE